MYTYSCEKWAGLGMGVIGFKMFLPAHRHQMRNGQVGEWGLVYLKKFPAH
jgi:hypothetical protein